jgi:hypothetical protein
VGEGVVATAVCVNMRMVGVLRAGAAGCGHHGSSAAAPSDHALRRTWV